MSIYFYIFMSHHCLSQIVRHCYSYHDGDNWDCSHWFFLFKVALYFWPSALERKRIPWWLHAPWVQKYNCLQNGTLLILLPPLVLLSLPPFLLELFNWVFICSISICICWICCISWGNISVGWLVGFTIWIWVSSLSLSFGCKTLAIPSNTYDEIFAD